MFENTPNIINHFKLLEKEEFITYNDDIELIFVELPKFKKELKELSNIKDEWIYFLKNAGSLEYIPNDLDNTIKEALNNVNEANLSKEELESQHKRKEFISIQKLAVLKADEDGFEKGMEKGLEQGLEKGMEKGMEKGLEKGMEKGLEQGLEQGAKNKQIEIAKKSLRQGLDIDTVVMITGLDQMVVEELNFGIA
jgi:predicted transposase/invertase (TIGR01784 family)